MDIKTRELLNCYNGFEKMQAVFTTSEKPSEVIREKQLKY